MDQKLKQILILFVALFLAKIAIADPMREIGGGKTARPRYLSSGEMQD